MNFQAASGSLGVWALMCNNGPQNNDARCQSGLANQMECYTGCGAMVSCASGDDVMGMCSATQCCNGSDPAPTFSRCYTGSSARYDCVSGGSFDQACCCTSTCVNNVNCTNGS
jgi:hypothetical protein